MEKKWSLSIAVRGLFVSAFLSTIFGVANASAYTVTYDANGAKFDNGQSINVVEYDDNGNIISGEYKKPVLTAPNEPDEYELQWILDEKGIEILDINHLAGDVTAKAQYLRVIFNYSYTGSGQLFDSPVNLLWKYELWGASGGTLENYGGNTPALFNGKYSKGAYTLGYMETPVNKQLYIYIGEKGCNGTTSSNSFNGGVGFTSPNPDRNNQGGGGATDIRLVNASSGSWYDLNHASFKTDESLLSRIMVAGGAGGTVVSSTISSNGDTKTSRGLALNSINSNVSQTSGNDFGLGRTGSRSGGGGGYWGGIISGNNGLGGTSYISGYLGSVAMSEDEAVAINDSEGNRCTNESALNDITCSYHVSGNIFKYGKMIEGENEMPSPLDYSATTIGENNNGFARVSYVTHKVTFIDDYQPRTVSYFVGENETTTPEDHIEKDGYSFAWYLNGDVFDFSTPISEDIELIGGYTPITYNLTYDLDGGTTPEANPASYTVETDDITLINPTKDYYDFIGWSGTGLTGNRNTSVTIAKGSTGDRSYEANYTATPYTITYNLDGGTNGANNPAEYNYESSEIVLARPTKEGHTFLGWSGTGIDGEDNLDVTIPAQSHGDREYTAHWSINQYTATFDVNGGSAISEDTITSDYGVAFGELPETHITGYTFLGWFTEQTSGTEISDTTTMPAEDHTYYAHWEIITYTIEYDLGGEDMDSAPTNDASNPTSYTVEDADITLKAATPGDTWHYFVGWALDRDTEDDLSDNFVIDTSEAKNIKVYAIFQANPYTVTLNPDNGDDEIVKTVRGDQEIGELPTPERAGYEFLGWFVGDKQIDEHFHPRSDSIAVARWAEILTVPDTGVNSTSNTGDAIMNYVVTSAVCTLALFIVVALRKRKAKNELYES